jgi:2-succinyl-6-hydroxy-2,4-cyclohexadiene-1-carboxylate synthase
VSVAVAETEAIVLLHGFGGTRHGWDAVIGELGRRSEPERYRPLAVDLPGHGEFGALRPISLRSSAEHVLALAPPRFVLGGYSMGGRIALHVALAAPQRVSRMVLISTTAGIDGGSERAQRRASDARLAAELEHEPFEQFIERWRNQPLFAGDPEPVREAARSDQRRNEPANLAASLRGTGTGEMEPLWERLAELTIPVIVLAGERDEKYCEIARRLVAGLPRAELRIVAGGHSLALENPRAVAQALAPEPPAGGGGAR